ncbi:MAG: hypothetical protein C0417_06085 [Chlorobiaceae bacterium]|nr:hypothetical protein [Chlorobiaceae bacterium]
MNYDETGIVMQRPVIPNEEKIISDNFVIHYSLSGRDSTTLEWAQATSVYAESVHSWLRSKGWRMQATGRTSATLPQQALLFQTPIPV